jgi:hypothetical protein
VIQLVHATPSLMLPWATVYDGLVPDDLDTSKLPVCHGFVAGAPCTHDGMDPSLLCVRRFWGLRHIVEIVGATGKEKDTVTRLAIEPARPLIRWLHGASVQAVPYMPADYESLLYQPGLPVWDLDVYDLLREERRPTIVIAMGHFEQKSPIPSAAVHSIDLVPRALTDVGVAQQSGVFGEWLKPQSLVLLMACSSAVDPSTALTTMIEAFAGAGAGAIVGTESVIYPRISARAACAIYRGLREDAGSLSKAMRGLRWELIGAANPLAFTFTAYGNADLAMETS